MTGPDALWFVVAGTLHAPAHAIHPGLEGRTPVAWPSVTGWRRSPATSTHVEVRYKSPGFLKQFIQIRYCSLLDWSPWVNSTCSETCGQGEMKEERQCISIITGDVTEPGVCGTESYSRVHQCLAPDLCWNNVIQRRGQFGNPVDYFYRNWDEYVDGFGETGEKRRK